MELQRERPVCFLALGAYADTGHAAYPASDTQTPVRTHLMASAGFGSDRRSTGLIICREEHGQGRPTRGGRRRTSVSTANILLVYTTDRRRSARKAASSNSGAARARAQASSKIAPAPRNGGATGHRDWAWLPEGPALAVIHRCATASVTRGVAPGARTGVGGDLIWRRKPLYWGWTSSGSSCRKNIIVPEMRPSM
jgi:hypothetical protein